jgi:arylsulfatase A-like enzyme
MRNEEFLDGPVDQTALTEDYTGEAIRWIQRWKGPPFFIYLAHTMPHKPLYASKRFLNTSRRGLYGDVIAELDSNVGRILQTLKTEGLDKDTLVIFTSDNGPWLSLKQHGGSAGPLRGSKGSTYEGGVRVPFIARWPGRIPAGRSSSDIASIMDLLPTSVALAGGKLPVKVQLDGVDVSSLLLEGKSRHAARRIFYYRGPDLEAVREGDWKVRLDARDPAAKLELFNLELDVSEAFNLAETFPEKAAKLKKLLEKERKEMVPGPAYQSLIESREKLQSIYQPRGGVKLVVPEPGVR